LSWTSYCEEQSDDGYTEDYAGKLSGVGRVTYYPHVFDGATLCYVTVSTADGAPQRVNGRMAASMAPGLGIKPKMEILGKRIVEIA